jgi:outer membrane protein assembly factor BamD (BamD/ComL family)
VAAFKEAESLLAASPGLAIVRLRAFKEHWPHSPLGEEASIRVIQALVALGRDADARAQAARFIEQYPRSSRRAELAAFADGVKSQRPPE